MGTHPPNAWPLDYLVFSDFLLLFKQSSSQFRASSFPFISSPKKPNNPKEMSSCSVQEEEEEEEDTVELAGPHEGLFLALAHLRFIDLFQVRRVCKSLRDAVDGDALLWRKVELQPPLSWKAKDSIVLELVSKAQGNLASLVLMDCCFITDSALQLVAQTNPHITKLHIPGCTALTPDGLVRAVEKLNNLSHLIIYGIPNLKKEHLVSLNSLLRINPQRPLVFYNGPHSPRSVMGNDQYSFIDVDICPKCNEVRIVFDCPRDECSEKWLPCRGCFYCVARCNECGGCVGLEEVVEGETVCLDFVCSGCWLRLPKCMLCNKPSCSQHLDIQPRSSPNSPYFTCERCNLADRLVTI